MPDLTSPQLIAFISAFAALVGTVIAIVKAHAAWRKWKSGWKHRIGNFLDDWEGRAARPGVDREPGVMERLKVLEDTQASQGETLATQDKTLETIRHEVEFNNGSSVKDAVVRTEKGQKELAAQLEAHLKPGPTTTINVNTQEGS
ncbi:hypothetical protein [Arthrobacter sp. efr-133-TYG-118]|uniref:hypothetical protein n=1 Tax=Arthrobacter sp. efr-133-TYG-118 TaxID=3040279 RepID=UPI00254D3335|nr:hypothetical protein [Arthrobacter sp. efr-133-TYG-118]